MKFNLYTLVGLCFFGICSTGLAQFGTNAPQAGEIPPPLQLGKIIQGPPLEEINWKTLKGKLVVLEFWNTACKPCIEAIPHFNQLAEEFKEKPVVFLSVSDDNEDHLRKFLKEHPMREWVALDGPNNATERALHLQGYGLIILLNPAGKVVVVSLPALLQAKHLDEILAGKRCSLPVLRFAPVSDSASPTNRVAQPR
jgi:thiol-disulfide isomerase/thioredoxin